MTGKRLRLLILALLAALMVFSCQTIALQPGSSQRVTLKLSGWGSSPAEQRLFQQLLADFQASHPQVRVKLETVADQYMDVIKTRLIGDAAPDVFFLDSFEAPFLMASEVLEPLENYITADFDLADFEETLIAPFRHQGHLYGLPKDCSTLALFYDTQAFAEAGLTRPPTTWSEFVATAQALTIDRDQNGSIDRYGYGMLPDLARLVYILQAFGGEAVNEQGQAVFASEAALQGLDQLVQQYQGRCPPGSCPRTIARPPDVGVHSGTEMLGQQKAAMVIEGNWAVPFLQDTFPNLKFATAEVPQINNRPGTMVYTVGYVMNRQSLHKPEAWELIRYLTGKAGMTRWTQTGIALPTRRSVAQQLQLDRDPLRSALVAGIPYATPWQLGLYPGAIMNSFNNQFMSALLGEQSLQSALQQAQDSANRQIREAEL